MRSMVGAAGIPALQGGEDVKRFRKEFLEKAIKAVKETKCD